MGHDKEDFYSHGLLYEWCILYHKANLYLLSNPILFPLMLKRISSIHLTCSKLGSTS